ncbi:MAG: UxaA family hydrolase [Planctomycetota bacterium]
MTRPLILTDYAVLLDGSDNVATALRDVPGGAYALPSGEPLDVPEPIPSAFKLAVEPIARGETIRKYGYPIGTATVDIAPGEQVHVHNLTSTVSQQQQRGDAS